MRKQIFGRKFSRGRKSREALFRSELRGIILSGKIITTRAKAKAIQGEIDRLFNLAKRNSLADQRSVLSILGNNREAANILFSKIGVSLGERRSGFTKIINLPARTGDRAEMARLEFTDKIELTKKKVVKAKVEKRK